MAVVAKILIGPCKQVFVFRHVGVVTSEAISSGYRTVNKCVFVLVSFVTGKAKVRLLHCKVADIGTIMTLFALMFLVRFVQVEFRFK